LKSPDSKAAFAKIGAQFAKFQGLPPRHQSSRLQVAEPRTYLSRNLHFHV
jgi:hypothetical protein